MKRAMMLVLLCLSISGCATSSQPDETGRLPKEEPTVTYQNEGINLDAYPPVQKLITNEDGSKELI